MLIEVDDPVLGKIKIQGVPIKLHSTPGSVQQPAPMLGEHTTEILLQMGYSRDEIKNLHDRNIV